MTITDAFDKIGEVFSQKRFYMDILAQAIGILAMIAIVLSFQFKSQRMIIFWQLIGSALFSINYFMLGALMGGILNAIAIVRAFVYMNKGRYKIPIKYVNLIFIVVYLLSYVLVFTVFGKDPTPVNLAVEVLPIIAMCTVTLGFGSKSARTVRICGLINSPCWLIYNSVNFALGGIICEILSIISVVSSYIRNDLKKTN